MAILPRKPSRSRGAQQARLAVSSLIRQIGALPRRIIDNVLAEITLQTSGIIVLLVVAAVLRVCTTHIEARVPTGVPQTSGLEVSQDAPQAPFLPDSHQGPPCSSAAGESAEALGVEVQAAPSVIPACSQSAVVIVVVVIQGSPTPLASPSSRPPCLYADEPIQPGSVYIVRPGDTLGCLALRASLPLDAIIAANPQVGDPDLIYPGEPIRIPWEPAQVVPGASR